METKVKKFIRNTPEEDLKNFLISNDFIEVPEDFNWDGKNRKYHASLFGMVWGCEDAKKQNLFDTIDRVHGMSDELGQNALCSIAGNDKIFLDQKGEYARGLYMHQKFPEKFRTAEFWVSHDYKRKSKEWSSFHGPQNKKLDKSEENITKFKEEVLSHLDISRKLNLEFSCRDKNDKDGNKLEICILTGFNDGLPQSIQTFDKDEVVTRHFAPAKDFSISYDPISGLIDVISNSKDNREFLAKKFANIFLKSADDKFEIRLKKYNLAKFKSYQDLMKDVDLKDGIENIKVTLIKLKPLNSKNSTTLESPFSEKRTIYEIAENWFADNNPLSSSFEIKKVKLSIKFKQDAKNPRGKLIHVNITDPNGCDLKDRTEKEKIIGDKYLEKWGIVEKI
jgi:hypothetical protein